MFGYSMEYKEFVKLSHFDRLRRGYIDQIPMNFGFIGFLLSINIFHLSSKFAMITGVILFFIGHLLKENMSHQDNAELKKHSREVEREYKERIKLMKS